MDGEAKIHESCKNCWDILLNIRTTLCYSNPNEFMAQLAVLDIEVEELRKAAYELYQQKKVEYDKES